MRLLHLEDSDRDAQLVSRLLRRKWPECGIERARNRDEFEAALGGGPYDFILSDFSLPDFDGLSALQIARDRCPDTPYIFISGTIGEERAIEALRLGASDYVLKDRPGRLVSAVTQALALAAEARRRRQSEEALRKSEEELRDRAILLDKARDAIIATDLRHRIIYWNASAERLYGWTAAEVAGRTIEELDHHVDPERFREARERFNLEGEWRGEFRKRTKGGAVVHVETTWSLVSDSEGRPRSFLAIDTDVTEKRLFEKDLLRTERLDSLGHLASGVAHDLNNVLTPILMAAEILRARLHEPGDRRLVETINGSAEHGAALVRQLVAFARGVEGERRTIDPAAVLGEVRVLLKTSLPKPVGLEVKAFAPSPILADPTQIKQVLLNLCLNARDAMPKGGRIEIRAENFAVEEKLARRHPGVRAGPHVRISVRDTGTGIPPEILDRIFDPFFTTKEEGKGSGLGLSTCAGIVRSHGGFITVESEPGKGSVFSVHFPAAGRP